MKTCPFCAEEIQDAAIVCKHCGADLVKRQPGARVATQPALAPAWSPGVAAVLSLLIPGLGQIYKGQVVGGLLWLVVVVIGYIAFIVPGLILHLCCIVGASMGDPYKGSPNAATGTVVASAAAEADYQQRMAKADTRGARWGTALAKLIHGRRRRTPPANGGPQQSGQP